jgi:tetratricopeptide (TPR) repeat protein
MKVNCSACGATNESSISECQFCGNSLSIQNIDIENKIKALNDQGNKFKLAEVAFEGENYDEAINYYNACLEIDPNFFEAWYKKGLSMIKTSTIGNFKSKQSISAFKQALNFSPNAENFKKRIKKELFPLVCDYYTIAINHFKEFSSLPNLSLIHI